MAARSFLDFVNASPSPFHAVASARADLLSAGFKELKERLDWSLRPSGNYFFSRNQSSLIAFSVPQSYDPSCVGFSIVAAHTDSPCLKLKPVSRKQKAGYAMLGVQCYGGGLWHTWFDRDLSVAGRVLVQNSDGTVSHHLVNIKAPILRIPTLAIHLDRGVNTDGFKINLETQLQPLLSSSPSPSSQKASEDDATLASDPHPPQLIAMIAKQLKVSPTQIKDLELCLFDTLPAAIGGINDEYIFSARLDNLMMSFCGLKAFINAAARPPTKADSQIRLLALFDNEEVGSQSAHGADSLMLESTLRRIITALPSSQPANQSSFELALHRSFLVSADMAHAIHPNYTDKHEENHRPEMNKGVVLKVNANQRYASTSVTTHILKTLATAKNLPLQEFVVRNDSPCGSTIGPILAANLGLRTVDIGNPQLSMHSIREMCGVADVQYAIDLLQAVFEDFATVDGKITVD